MNNLDFGVWFLVLISVAVFVIAVGIVFIWALNALFSLRIAYSLKDIVAGIILLIMFWSLRG
jgi:hypothetical protein